MTDGRRTLRHGIRSHGLRPGELKMQIHMNNVSVFFVRYMIKDFKQRTCGLIRQYK